MTRPFFFWTSSIEMWNYYAPLFPEQHFERVYSKTRALQTHHARVHLTAWCALWEWGKKHLELSGAPTAKDLHQIALVLFTETALIKAVLHGRRGVCVGRGCISRSTHMLNGAQNFYLMRAFLPQVCVPTAKQQISTLLQVFTLHFGNATFFMYLAVFNIQYIFTLRGWIWKLSNGTLSLYGFSRSPPGPQWEPVPAELWLKPTRCQSGASWRCREGRGKGEGVGLRRLAEGGGCSSAFNPTWSHWSWRVYQAKAAWSLNAHAANLFNYSPSSLAF